jgi:hypothetical protein
METLSVRDRLRHRSDEGLGASYLMAARVIKQEVNARRGDGLRKSHRASKLTRLLRQRLRPGIIADIQMRSPPT